jgi:mono/diheme cytochrome c family protein
MGAVVTGIVGLTVVAAVTTPPQEPVAAAGTVPQQIALGQNLYSLNCTQCHGPEGEGGIIQGVTGLDGFKMKALHSQDEMYTRTDETLADIIAFGQPNLGMQPFGQAYGGALSPTEINAIVTFMRYTWDDRSVLPAGASLAGGIPALKPGEVPSYDVHIGPLVTHYCVSCHSAGKVNNNYLMTSYKDMLNSGDNAPVVSAGDSQSLLLKLITGHTGLDPKTGQAIRQMPPTKLIDQQYIDMITQWVMAGMPQTAQDAAKAPTPTPKP